MKTTILLVTILLSFTALAQNLEDGFEGPELNKLWRRDLSEPGRLTLQSEVVRSGQSALRIDLHKGDRYEAGDAESLPSERTEIGEMKKLEALEGNTYDYSFSLFIPQDFPIADVRLNLAQWKQRCLLDSCDPENALIAVQYINGKLIIKRQHTKKPERIFETDAEVRNQWLDFKFRIKYSRQNDGLLIVTLNSKEIVNYAGITGWPPRSIGYRDSGNTFYFKMGLYRDEMDAPMTLYVDDYKRELVSPLQ